MRLVVDTSVLVGELLRTSGRSRLGDERLQLFLPEQRWGETRVELPRRVAAFLRGRGVDRSLGDELVSACFAAVEANVAILDEAIYAALEEEARARSLRDPRDWPAVASALALGAGIWTNDNDFLGTGIATWTTETLAALAPTPTVGMTRPPLCTPLREVRPYSHDDSAGSSPRGRRRGGPERAVRRPPPRPPVRWPVASPVPAERAPKGPGGDRPAASAGHHAWANQPRRPTVAPAHDLAVLAAFPPPAARAPAERLAAGRTSPLR